ncbi:MAG: Ig-like domain-containing protein [Thermodesulfobacteriota bacterium]
MSFKKFSCFLLLPACLLLLTVTRAPAAPPLAEFTLELPTGTEVTMGDTSADLPFLVTNSASSTKDIRSLRIVIDSSVYEIDQATNPISGWEVKSMSTDTICIARATGGIAPGDTDVFTLILTGPSGGIIGSDVQDMTDEILSVQAKDADTCGDEFTLTNSLPSWDRRSLAIDLFATPATVGIGDTITLTMQVSNRSIATQSLITAVTDPPVAYLYGLTSLAGLHLSGVGTFNVDSTASFPGSGTVRLDADEPDYTAIDAISFTLDPGTPTSSFHADGTTIYNRNSTAAVSNSTGPTYEISPFTLDPNTSAVITWTYTADSSATLYFSSAAEDSTGDATSKMGNSNPVIIGDFTAIVEVSPLAVVDGQTVTVTMTVANNGNSALGNIQPTLTTGGTATATLVSGPTPAKIFILTSGGSGTFTWTYTINGGAGDTYFFEGYAEAAAPVTTNTSTSEAGRITLYAVVVDPDVVATGTTNLQVEWTLHNRGGETVKEVYIPLPAGWTYSSSSSPGWNASYDGTNVTFTSPSGPDNIPVGGSRTFYITFSSIPPVVSDTPYTFPLVITDKKNNNASVDSTVVISSFVMVLTYSPAAPIDADAASQYTLTATLTRNGTPVTDVIITFTTTAGSLSASSATTDTNGVATVTLTSPCSQTDVDALINAIYLNAEDPQTVSPAFSGITGGNLVYVGATFVDALGGTSPPDVSNGDTVTLELNLINCGDTDLDITDATLEFGSDSFGWPGGTVTVLADGTTQATLTFNSGAIASADIQCYPTLTLDAGVGYTGTFSSGDPVYDYITVDSGETCPTAVDIDVIDWHETY